MDGYYKGQICETDAARGLVRVTIAERGGVVSDWLSLLAFEYDMPDIGDWVGVIVNSNGQGICLGKIFSNSQTPEKNGGYYKKMGGAEIEAEKDFIIDFGGGAYIKVSDGNVFIKGKNVIILEDN